MFDSVNYIILSYKECSLNISFVFCMKKHTCKVKYKAVKIVNILFVRCQISYGHFNNVHVAVVTNDCSGNDKYIFYIKTIRLSSVV